MVALLKRETVAYLHMYGKSDQRQVFAHVGLCEKCPVVTFGSQFSQHLTFKQSQRDHNYTNVCNLLRNLLRIMRLAVMKSLSLKSANSAIC